MSESWTDFTSNGDPRLAHLPLMGSPLPVLTVVIVYVYLVKYVGPRFMQNREPYNIKWVILLYNFSMVLLSTYLFIRGGIYGWFGHYSFKCEPLDYTESRNGVGMAYTAYIYFLSKIIELLDTIFFVLRKKFDHISSLHVTHHATLAWTMYWGVKYYPTGHGSFGPFFNTFVHIVMYTYYFLAALGPSVQPYLWWKKYLTQLQLFQFVIIFMHASQVFFRKDCNYPKGVMFPFLTVVIYFIVMFVDFYQNEYIKKHRPKTVPSSGHGHNNHFKNEGNSSSIAKTISRMRRDVDTSRFLNGTDHHHLYNPYGHCSDTEHDHFQ